MGIKGKVPRDDTRGTGGLVSWIVIITGAALIIVGAIGLWTEIDLTFHGILTTARVIAHQHAAGDSHMASIVAQVEVAVPNGRAFRTEVEDQFGTAEWVDGDTVNLMCAKLATDYPHCELGSMRDRWLAPVGFLVAGLGVVWWWWRRWLTRT